MLSEDELERRRYLGIDPKAARKRLADKGTESGGSLAGPLEMLEIKLDKPLKEQDARTKTGNLDLYDGRILLEDMEEKGPLSAGLMKRGGSYNSAATYNAKDGFPIKQAKVKPTPMDTDEFGPSNTAMNAGEFAGPLASSRAQGMQSGVEYPTDKPLPRSLAGQASEDPNRPKFDSFSDMFSNMFSKK